MEESNKKSVIIRFPNWLGDCIMATPVLALLKQARPEWEITLMARGVLHELFENDPHGDDIIEFDDKESYIGPLKYLPIAEKLREKDFYLGILMPDSFSSALIFYLATIPHRIGYKGDARSFMLTRAVPHSHQIIHRSRKYTALLEKIGIKVEAIPMPEIFPGENNISEAENYISGLGDFVVIAPYSNAPSRRWGYEKYAELAGRIKKELNLAIVLIGAANEAKIIESVGEKSGVPFMNLAGKTSLLTSYEIMKHASAFIGNDSGGAHLAAASGTHTISLSGADNPDETHPLTENGGVIRKPLPCSPCVKNICPRHDLPMECMQVISVDDVFRALKCALNV
jgi:heptosyltransferase II